MKAIMKDVKNPSFVHIIFAKTWKICYISAVMEMGCCIEEKGRRIIQNIDLQCLSRSTYLFS